MGKQSNQEAKTRYRVWVDDIPPVVVEAVGFDAAALDAMNGLGLSASRITRSRPQICGGQSVWIDRGDGLGLSIAGVRQLDTSEVA